jgi:DNA-binding Xre family transcriptional regulator
LRTTKSYTIIGRVKVVNSHFRVLVAQKELREKRRIGIRVIVEEAKASRSAVERLLNNTIKQVPLDDLAAICVWMGCEPGDILRLEPLPEEFATPQAA